MKIDIRKEVELKKQIKQLTNKVEQMQMLLILIIFDEFSEDKCNELGIDIEQIMFDLMEQIWGE